MALISFSWAIPSYGQIRPDTSYFEVAIDLAPLLYEQSQGQVLLRQYQGNYAWRYGLNFQLFDSDNNLESTDAIQENQSQSMSLGLSFGWQQNWGQGPLRTYYGAQATVFGRTNQNESLDRRFWGNGNFSRVSSFENSTQSIGITLSPLLGFWYQWFDCLRVGAEIAPQISLTYSMNQTMNQLTEFDVLGNTINEVESQRDGAQTRLNTTLDRSSLAIWFSCLF
ncbi:MAG: hypothetical protein AAF804_07015 [Bacteroidota bacterium]